ncbi:MAG TPA: site-specific DNA-methyltransferase [Candidatus Tumulicola sp.]|nr:site-specific DNA-methyltransferase [Candidatus Tumulicola sp.]
MKKRVELEGLPIRWQSEDGRAALCAGDALDLITRIPADTVDCIWTDPPYLLSNGGMTCVAGRMVRVDKGDWDRSKGLSADHEFNLQWIQECYRVLKPTGTIWVSGTTHVYLSVGMAMLQSGFRILNDIIWEKPAPPPNLGCRCFTHSTETILWASKAPKGSSAKYTFNYDQLKALNGGRQMKNVWRLSTPSTEEKRLGKHPTQKPVSLVERCLAASTNKNDVVLDPFSGSATTGVAALRLKRRFIGFERDKAYLSLGSRRLASEAKAPEQPRLIS